MSKKFRYAGIALVALLLMLTLTQCVTPTPEVVERIVEKEVVVTREVEKEVVVTREVEVQVQPDYVTLRANWLFGGAHAFLFYAREQGYFREQNLVVDIREGNGSGNVVRTIINKGDDFALISAGTPMISIAQGAPIKLIYTWIGSFDWGYTCHPQSQVNAPKDLEGKIIVSSPGNAGLAYHPIFVERAGLDTSKMQELYLVDGGAMVNTALSGKGDCLLSGYPAVIPLWEKEGVTPSLVTLESVGPWGPSGGFITHQDTIDQKPDVVRRMLTALRKGQEACAQDVAGCMDALLLAHPQLDKEAETRSLEIYLGTWLGPNQKCMGEFIEENWTALLQLMKTTPDSPLKDDTRAITAFFDAQFLPACQ